MKKIKMSKILIHAFFILLCICYILPLVMVVSISLSSETAVTAPGAGYSLLPQDFTLDAYRMAFEKPKTMIMAYVVTIGQSVLGTAGALLVSGMMAYALSRTGFAFKGFFTFIVFFTMLFSGGMIPTYIVYTQMYHLGNNFLVYILPGLAGGAWNTLMIRTFFKGIPESLFESAKLDGAGEFTIFLRIAAPLSKPVFATVGFMQLVAKWNDWNTSLIYIRNESLYTLQYLLQRVLNEVEFLKRLANDERLQNIGFDVSQLFETPMETYRYALCVIAAGPMLLVFPFFQKYFAKGTVVGSVKG